MEVSHFIINSFLMSIRNRLCINPIREYFIHFALCLNFLHLISWFLTTKMHEIEKAATWNQHQIANYSAKWKHTKYKIEDIMIDKRYDVDYILCDLSLESDLSSPKDNLIIVHDGVMMCHFLALMRQPVTNCEQVSFLRAGFQGNFCRYGFI